MDDHSEQAAEHGHGEQDTGNHPKPGSAQSGGPDRFGGTRAGAGTLEPTPPDNPATTTTGEVPLADGTERRDILDRDVAVDGG